MDTNTNDESLETLLKDFTELNKNSPLVDKNCKKIEQGIVAGKYTILQLIEQLGNLLTHFTPAKRELGLEILTRVLEILDDVQLSSEQLRFISSFYADRLKDHHQVIPPAIGGILALTKFNNFPDGSASEILTSLFLNIPCQQQQYLERQNIYLIFQVLLERKTEELINMGLDFVYGVISAMDSERDPRNLLLLFKWLPKFLRTVTLGHLNEEMFETIACYFPVDFRAPTQDSNAITRDMLANSLCPCLCALPSFAQFCLPLALEKLDSSLRIAKLDSLKLLKEGCKIFEVGSYQENSIQIWSLIYKELLQNSGDKELESACLETLTAYISKLSDGPESAFKLHLKDIIDTIKANLLPDAKLFEVTSKILLHITKASQPSAAFTAKEILPIVTNTFNITKTPAHQAKLLRILVSFVRILNDMFDGHNGLDVAEIDQTSLLCVVALTHGHVEMRLTAWNSVGAIAQKLTQNLKGCVFEAVRTNLTRELEEAEREALLLCFKTLAAQFPDEIRSEVIEKVEVARGIKLQLFIEALARIATHKQLFGVVFPVMMRYCFGDVEEAEIAFPCLCEVLKQQETNAEVMRYLNENLGAIQGIIKWVIGNQTRIDVTKRKLLENISVILTITVGSLDEQKQLDLLRSDVNQIIQGYKTTLNTIHVILLNGLLLRINENIDINPEILETIFVVTFESHTDYMNEISMQLFANILNKVKDQQVLDVYLNKIAHKCQSDVNSITINAVSWITKALLMRNYPQASLWIEKVLELIENHEEASATLKIIMSDRSDALSVKSRCRVVLFYRQKFFLYISNKLNEIHPNISSNLLIAFSYLLQETPHQILLSAVDKTFKTIILCMENCAMPEALCSICEALLKLTEDVHPLIDEHISDLLPRFLKLSAFKSSMKVRIAALKCIKAFTSGYPVYKLLPHKQGVVFELAASLDDPKRLVRKEAVETRSRWILVDAPI